MFYISERPKEEVEKEEKNLLLKSYLRSFLERSGEAMLFKDFCDASLFYLFIY